MEIETLLIETALIETALIEMAAAGIREAPA
jgi:hypothetical protein